MIYSVIYDLRIFLFFYGILLLFFSLIFAVLGVGNVRQPGNMKDLYEGLQQDAWDNLSSEDQAIIAVGDIIPEGFPNEEYKLIDPMMGHLFSALRTSLGDNDFGASTQLSPVENFLFWIL